MATLTARTDKIDLRLSPAAKQTLHAAARTAQLSVSQFVLESALARAAETLAERQRFELDAEKWTEFMVALDAPPREIPRLRRLFAEPGPFDAPEAA